jgi:predicted transcriptional regulator of viral defense system
MINKNSVIEEFNKYGGVLKTSELNSIGLSSRQIKKFIDDEFIVKVKFGFYELAEAVNSDEVIIARLFPNAVIFLESALMHYEYTDRIPSLWQIAVDKDSKKSKYDIEYPLIQPFYIEFKFLEVGLDVIQIDGVDVKIFDRDRTICDILRYENKIENEVFSEAIKRYSKDSRKNVRNLFEYAEIFNIKKKVQTYIGMWL